MKFVETPIAGAWLVDLERKTDDRGFFARVWCEEEFARHGLTTRFVQCNNGYSCKAGTLRGLHYQADPYGEVKFVRCVRGAVFDVIADVRSESPSYQKWFGTELTAENRRMLYVPAGCAHGYLALQDESEVMYPVSVPYTPSAERGVRWNDPFFAIDWPEVPERYVSEKDRAWPNFVPARGLV